MRCCRGRRAWKAVRDEPSQPGQAAARGRGDVRPGGRTLRRHERRALARPGPPLAPRRAGGGRPEAGGSRPRPGGRDRDTSSVPFVFEGATVVPCDFSVGMLRGRQAGPAAAAVRRRRRDPAAVRRRDVRRGDDLVRAAQRRTTTRVGSPRCCGSRSRAVGSSCASSASRRTRTFRKVYSEYLMKALPAVARAVSRPTPTPTSIWPSRSRPGPTSRGLPTAIGRSGWRSVEWRNLTGGIVALHRPRSGPRDPAAVPGRGVGWVWKTLLARSLARELGAGWLQLDSIWLAIKAGAGAGSAAYDLPRHRPADATRGRYGR